MSNCKTKKYTRLAPEKVPQPSNLHKHVSLIHEVNLIRRTFVHSDLLLTEGILSHRKNILLVKLSEENILTNRTSKHEKTHDLRN